MQQGSRFIHLVVGPVGAGKSTLAVRLSLEHAAVRLTLDEWMSRLFAPDRPSADIVPWYVERSARCIDQIWSVAQGILDAGRDVVLEIGLLSRREREAFYGRVEDAGIELAMYVVDAPRDVRRKRVERRNQERGATFSMVVPPAIFEMASDLWEPPGNEECEGRNVRFIHSDEA